MEMTAIETVNAAPIAARFTVDAKPLADALAFMTGRIVERRNTVPILSNVVLVAWPGRVDILGNDLDVMARIAIAADTLAPGAFTLDAGALLAIAKKAGAGARLEFVQDDGRVIIDTGASKARLPFLPADDFPLPTPISADCHRFTLSADFVQDLASVAPFIETSGNRYYLQGVALQRRQLAGRDRLLIAATNGRELSAWSRAVPDGAECLPDVILPAKMVKALQAMRKLASDAPLMAECNRAGLTMSIECGPVFLQSKLIDGTFPDIETVAAASIGDDPAQPLLIPELDPDMNPATLERMAKATGADLSWENVGAFMLASDPANPDWFGMAGKGGMPKGYAIDYQTARDNAAFYLCGLAERAGLDLGNVGRHLIDDGAGNVQGLTIGEQVYIPAAVDYVQDWESLTMRKVETPARWEYAEGAYSVAMPRERQKMEAACSLTVDGQTYPLATNSRGDIHLSKEAVRRIIGESCFETMAVTLPDGRAAYVLRWLWDEGVTRFCTVRADGRCATGKAGDGTAGIMITRAEIERGAVEPIAAMESPAPIVTNASRGAVSPGPMWQGEAWPCALSECARKDVTCFDDQGGRISLIADERNSNYRTRIPAAWQAKAREYFDAQTRALADGAMNRRWDPIPAHYLGDDAPISEPTPEILPAQTVEPESATDERPEAVSTPSGPEIAPAGEIAPGDDLAARLDALEMAVKALQAVQVAPVAGDVAQARPKRTPAHERVIRRAWAERKARRVSAETAKLGRSESALIIRALKAKIDRRNRQLSARVNSAYSQRRVNAYARDALTQAREQRDAMRQTADNANAGLAQAIGERNAARAELAMIKRSLADPSNPMRADDAARLIDEAQAAKARAATLEQQNAQMKAMTERGADQLEAMISRVTRAEAALRKAGLLSAPLAIVAPDQVAA